MQSRSPPTRRAFLRSSCRIRRFRWESLPCGDLEGDQLETDSERHERERIEDAERYEKERKESHELHEKERREDRDRHEEEEGRDREEDGEESSD